MTIVGWKHLDMASLDDAGGFFQTAGNVDDDLPFLKGPTGFKGFNMF